MIILKRIEIGVQIYLDSVVNFCLTVGFVGDDFQNGWSSNGRELSFRIQ